MPKVEKKQENEQLIDLLKSVKGRFYVDHMINVVMQKPHLIETMIEILEADKPQLSLNSAWVLSTISDDYPEMLLPYLNRFVKINQETKSDSIRRNLTRIIEKHLLMISKEEALDMIELYDLCLKWMISENYSVSVRCNAITILCRFCEIEPELIPETLQQIELIRDSSSVGIKSRAVKTFQYLQKLNGSNRFTH